MFKASKLIAALAILPILAYASPVHALTPSPLAEEGIYGVFNVTQHPGDGEFASSAKAIACGDVMLFGLVIANISDTEVRDIVVSATLPTSTGAIALSTATAQGMYDDGTDPKAGVTVSGTAQVDLLPNSHLSYIPGTTQLATQLTPGQDDGSYISEDLADGVINDHMVVGDPLIAGESEVLVFQASVECDSTPPTTNDGVDAPAINTSIKEVAKTNTVSTVNTKSTPRTTILTKTGVSDIAALFAAAAVIGIAAYDIMRRMNAR
ncbi:hypothetical protein BH09PAT3_BH09PAT3_6100 [soil metagenome]